jgi:hypothetical protein
MKEIIVLVTGQRHWNDYKQLAIELEKYHPTGIIHGAAAGADTLANIWAINNNVSVLAVPADWKRYGRAAGMIRNEQMLAILLDLKEQGAEVYVEGFVDEDVYGPSIGSLAMLKLAREEGVTLHSSITSQSIAKAEREIFHVPQ